MVKKRKLNKAVTDSISGLLDQGINVNVNIKTEVLVRLAFFAIIVTAAIGVTNFTLFRLKH